MFTKRDQETLLNLLNKQTAPAIEKVVNMAMVALHKQREDAEIRIQRLSRDIIFDSQPAVPPDLEEELGLLDHILEKAREF